MAFSDEAGFTLDGVVNSQNMRRYSEFGHGRPEVMSHTTQKFPAKLMVFMGVHSSGKTFGLTFYKQGESLTAATYRKLLEEKVIPELKCLNPDSPGTLSGMTWVQDGASIHCAKMRTGGWWYNNCYRAHPTGLSSATKKNGRKYVTYYHGGERGYSIDSWSEAEYLLVPN